MTDYSIAYALVERVVGRHFAWRFGRWLYLGSRREMRNDPRCNGEYRLLRDWLQHSTSSGPVYCLDVGANLGDWSCEFLRLQESGLERLVVRAFEPGPEQRQRLLARFTADIRDGRVIVDERAVGAAEGEAQFMLTGPATGSSALVPDTPRLGGQIHMAVQVTTLDSLSKETGIGSFGFVKVDTEGNDFNVIKGAESLLSRGAIHVLQFEYNSCWVNFRYFLKDVFDFLTDKPYALARVTSDGLEVYEQWHPEFERFIETNYALVRRDLLPRLRHRFYSISAANVVRPVRHDAALSSS